LAITRQFFGIAGEPARYLITHQGFELACWERCEYSVPVMIALEWPLRGHADIGGLLR